MNIGIDPAARCPHGNDFKWECPTCYGELKRRIDVLTEREKGLSDFVYFVVTYCKDRHSVKVSDMRYAMQAEWRNAERVLAALVDEQEGRS